MSSPVLCAVTSAGGSKWTEDTNQAGWLCLQGAVHLQPHLPWETDSKSSSLQGQGQHDCWKFVLRKLPGETQYHRKDRRKEQERLVRRVIRTRRLSRVRSTLPPKRPAFSQDGALVPGPGWELRGKGFPQAPRVAEQAAGRPPLERPQDGRARGGKQRDSGLPPFVL